MIPLEGDCRIERRDAGWVIAASPASYLAEIERSLWSNDEPLVFETPDAALAAYRRAREYEDGRKRRDREAMSRLGRPVLGRSRYEEDAHWEDRYELRLSTEGRLSQPLKLARLPPAHPLGSHFGDVLSRCEIGQLRLTALKTHCSDAGAGIASMCRRIAERIGRWRAVLAGRRAGCPTPRSTRCRSPLVRRVRPGARCPSVRSPELCRLRPTTCPHPPRCWPRRSALPPRNPPRRVDHGYHYASTLLLTELVLRSVDQGGMVLLMADHYGARHRVISPAPRDIRRSARHSGRRRRTG